jgi:hypothetical protein
MIRADAFALGGGGASGGSAPDGAAPGAPPGNPDALYGAVNFCLISVSTYIGSSVTFTSFCLKSPENHLKISPEIYLTRAAK